MTCNGLNDLSLRLKLAYSNFYFTDSCFIASGSKSMQQKQKTYMIVGLCLRLILF